ncbi:MAG: thioredoxin domain-containing protein [Chloroflexi bacterium]|nr:thioredoxin domain-containing protein [Chloroflexota bacterium]
MSKNEPTRKGSKPIGESGSVSGSGNRRMLWIVIGAAVGLIIILALIALLSGGNDTSTADAGTASSLAETIGQPVDGRLMGDPKAPVLIEAFEDFQCPHCQLFNVALGETIKNDLVAPGIARYEFKHRFVINEGSITIGAATECAVDQGMFWEYHDALFTEIENNASAGLPPGLKRIAADVGLDENTFERCLDSREHYEQMLREDNEARNRDINSTPIILINGTQFRGEFDPEAFKAAVEAAAADAS